MEAGVIEVGLFLLTQTGALIYFGATLKETVREHDRRIEANELAAKELRADVTKLQILRGQHEHSRDYQDGRR